MKKVFLDTYDIFCFNHQLKFCEYPETVRHCTAFVLEALSKSATIKLTHDEDV